MPKCNECVNCNDIPLYPTCSNGEWPMDPGRPYRDEPCVLFKQADKPWLALDSNEEKVLKVLKQLPGKENAITAERLAIYLGLRDKRQAREIISSLRYKFRLHDCFICSNFRYGFWLAKNKDEIQDCMKALYSFQNEIANTIRDLEGAQERWSAIKKAKREKNKEMVA